MRPTNGTTLAQQVAFYGEYAGPKQDPTTALLLAAVDPCRVRAKARQHDDRLATDPGAQRALQPRRRAAT